MPLYATAGLPPLRVGVDTYSPPFIMEGADNQLFGFDISMMLSLCKILGRPCHFESLPFKDLINAVISGEVDVAVSSIFISPARSKVVNFSIPYLLSYSRILGPKKYANKPFSVSMLAGAKIGVLEGTLYQEALTDMGVKKPVIVSYREVNDLIQALSNGDVDFALLDNPTVLYWQSQSSGSLVALGNRQPFGFGLGIVINKNNLALLKNINAALLQYQSSNEFKVDYDKYLAYF